MVLLLNFWAALLVTLALAVLVLQLLGTMTLLGIKLSAVPAVILVLAIGRGVHFTVHLCLVSYCSFPLVFRVSYLPNGALLLNLDLLCQIFVLK